MNDPVIAASAVGMYILDAPASLSQDTGALTFKLTARSSGNSLLGTMKPVLYAGDDRLTSAAAYLSGVMTHCRIPFDYVPSASSLAADILRTGRRLLILSDFPARHIPSRMMTNIQTQIREGMGLLMIGGWQSFHGREGEYNATPIEEALPVSCGREDDRVNCCHGLVPIPRGTHAVTRGLPWKMPPVICGYNRVLPREDSDVVMSLRQLRMTRDKAVFGKEKIPLLIFGEYGKGKTAALATDLAPHWVGGLVDWGEKRIGMRAAGANAVEVGEHYVKLVANIINWFL
jgi:hypothetical protein